MRSNNSNGRFRCSQGARCFVALLAYWSLIGLGLLGSGLYILISPGIRRSKEIKSVENAVRQWSDNSSPYSWRNFQRFNGYVSIKVGPYGAPGCDFIKTIIKLTPEACPRDVYLDQASRFESYKQLAFCANVPYRTFVVCDLRAEVLVLQPGAGYNTSLIQLPNLMPTTPGTMDILKCSHNCDTHACHKCKNAYRGALRCAASERIICRTKAYVTGLAVKVAYTPGASPTYNLDSSKPALDSTNSFGANVLPEGFTDYTASYTKGIRGPTWRYEQTVPSPPDAMANLTVTVRSSSDPWLTYLAETNGSMYFRPAKCLLAVGILLVVFGVIFSLFALVKLLTCRASLQDSGPQDEPSGGCAGSARNDKNDDKKVMPAKGLACSKEAGQ